MALFRILVIMEIRFYISKNNITIVVLMIMSNTYSNYSLPQILLRSLSILSEKEEIDPNVISLNS